MSVDFEKYKDWAMSRVNVQKALSQDEYTVISLGAFGLAGETGEVVDCLKKSMFHGRGFSDEQKQKLKLEMGDLLWYYAVICKEMGFTMEEIIDDNVSKLLSRDGANNEKFHEARI